MKGKLAKAYEVLKANCDSVDVTEKKRFLGLRSETIIDGKGCRVDPFAVEGMLKK